MSALYTDKTLVELGRALYETRLKEAWGQHWQHKDRWPADEEAWRAYPHHPIAEVDLTLAQAAAALMWFRDRKLIGRDGSNA